MNKKVKKCVAYYLKYINSEEYKRHIEEEFKESRENHRKYISDEKPQWKNRTDYYDDCMILKVLLFDILSNDGIIKLLKKIYKLPKKMYSVTNYYKKPTFINKYDYIHLQYFRSGSGRFAEIKFLKDKYIDHIDISFAQINNFYAILEYRITFKKCLKDESFTNFMCDNITKLTSKDYSIWYNILCNKKYSQNKEIDYLLLQQMNTEYFPIICQHYITSLLYSEQGKYHPLINIIFTTRKECIDIDKMYLSDMGMSFYNKSSNYIITCDYNKINYVLESGNNSIPSFGISGYISKYGNMFYNIFLAHKDLEAFEVQFSKFFNGRKKMFYNKRLNKLMQKTQSLSNVENKLQSNFYDDFNKNWDFYLSNDKSDFEEYNESYNKNYSEIYKENFSYLKMLAEINYIRINFLTSIIAMFASSIAAIIAIIALFA